MKNSSDVNGIFNLLFLFFKQSISMTLQYAVGKRMILGKEGIGKHNTQEISNA